MCPRSGGSWQRGQLRRGTSSSTYWYRSEIFGRHGHIILHARPNRGEGGVYSAGGGALCCLWRCRRKEEVGENCVEV